MMVERRRPAGSSPIVLTPHVEPIQTPASISEPPPAPVTPAAAAPPVPEKKAKREPRATTAAPVTAPELPAADPKVQRTFQFRDSLIKRAETAVLRTGGQGGHTSMTALLNAALERELQRLEVEFNDGEPFPANRGTFRTGRPIGS